MPPYLVGLDLGQAQDYSALVVVEEQQTPLAQPVYAVRVLHRWPLQTPYPVIVRQTEALLTRPPLVGKQTLLADHTGCGRPVIDAIRQTGLTLIAVTLHGGDTVSHVGANWRVPKRDLVGVVQVLLQQQRLQFAQAVPLTAVLTQELLTFKVTIDPATAHDSYSAWREKYHDDLVLALALPLWWAERESLTGVPPGLALAPVLTGLRKPSGFRSPGSTPRVFRGDYGLDEELF